MMRQKTVSILLSLILSLFLLSGSIAFPILDRNCYYTQIDRLHLTEQTGYPEETIREAYDDILDYCTGGGERAGRAFRTGPLAWSESGKSHFDDVEKLMRLDLRILAVTALLLAAYLVFELIWRRRKKQWFRPYRFLRRGPLFWGPAVMAGVFAVLGGLAAADFEAFFTGFHKVFFPGKENWVLDWYADEIIRILPEEVFLHFGLIILGLLVSGCVACMAADIALGRKGRPSCPGGR